MEILRLIMDISGYVPEDYINLYSCYQGLRLCQYTFHLKFCSLHLWKSCFFGLSCLSEETFSPKLRMKEQWGFFWKGKNVINSSGEHFKSSYRRQFISTCQEQKVEHGNVMASESIRNRFCGCPVPWKVMLYLSSHYLWHLLPAGNELQILN